jgi:hypothetical protein
MSNIVKLTQLLSNETVSDLVDELTVNNLKDLYFLVKNDKEADEKLAQSMLDVIEYMSVQSEFRDWLSEIK